MPDDTLAKAAEAVREWIKAAKCNVCPDGPFDPYTCSVQECEVRGLVVKADAGARAVLEAVKQASSGPLVEALAELAHTQWSGWMEYLFSKCSFNPDGTATIPAWAVERWKRQLSTPYADLPEEEKESDRIEARRMLEAAGYYDICEKAAAVCASKHHVSTSVDGYGHSEIDWQLLRELEAALQRAGKEA